MQNHVRAERPGAHPVIYLTRIDGSRLVVNAELIETVEHTADTVINLVDGKRLIVAETVEQVVEEVVAYRQRVARGSLRVVETLDDDETAIDGLHVPPRPIALHPTSQEETRG